MNSKEFKKALDAIVKEKDISEDYILEAMELALVSAYKKNYHSLANVRVSGRDGMIGARSKDEIAVMALRGGDIVGRHTVGFYNDGEYIELNHTATSRATFAKGAIKAGIWLANKEPKLYTIYDALGI